MLFNSFQFIFGLLPLSLVGYFMAARFSMRLAILWLVLVSLFFYGWWRPSDLPLFLGSIGVNFAIGRFLHSAQDQRRRQVALAFGLLANLSVLALFKYSRFAIENLNALSGASLPWPAFILPLGISFFTFTQITYLVDTYRHRHGGHPLSNYALFVSFFPHLLAGPILHHGEMLPQFADRQNKRPRAAHLWRGLALFSVGLAKKVLLADALAPFVRSGFDSAAAPGLLDAWLAALAYFFQIYFDFSGYTDMAIGAAFLFNIRLPFNFASPYRALDIQQFWRRWHITLGTFVRDYVYIPLGGSRLGRVRTLWNLFAAALLSGLWHGAGWSFVLWGVLHGGAMVLHNLWKHSSLGLPRPVAWATMFLFIVITWIPFRAPTWERTQAMLAGISGRHGMVLPLEWKTRNKAVIRSLQKAGIVFGKLATPDLPRLLGYLCLAALIAFWPGNSNALLDETLPVPLWRISAMGLLATASILNLNKLSEFIYFNF